MSERWPEGEERLKRRPAATRRRIGLDPELPKVGDILTYTTMGHEFKMEVLSIDPARRTGEVRMISAEEPEWIKEQRAKGDCALENGWCLVHGAADTMDHHFKTHPNAYND